MSGFTMRQRIACYLPFYKANGADTRLILNPENPEKDL